MKRSFDLDEMQAAFEFLDSRNEGKISATSVEEFLRRQGYSVSGLTLRNIVKHFKGPRAKFVEEFRDESQQLIGD